MKIFVTHNPEDREMYFHWAMEPLAKLGEVVLNPFDRNLTTEELIEAAAGCKVVIVHRATAAPAAVFDSLPDMVALLRPQLDIRTIDVDAASRNGVLIANAPATFVPSTAEMVLAQMLALARNVALSTMIYHEGREPETRLGVQLRDSTAGIIGYGAIGEYLADILLAMGMRVLVSDPYKTVDRPGIEQTDLDSLVKEADFLLPLALATKETENLIDARILSLMKPGAFLVNCSRGDLIDEKALEETYKAGRLGGLAMDVGRATDQRPSPHLAELPGVVATPHLGGLTVHAARPQTMSPVEQIQAILDGKMPPRAVNPDHATRLKAYWKG
ncbi:MAG: NAD(P)-binding domain-containing protein [Alphaproteobacteria bacterium]|nr:NAD(P)-binding domain-containing protein [Alphaproteobacteria bacterium]